VVSEELCGGGDSFGGDRSKVYSGASGEKVSRARFKSAVERNLSQSGLIVIADGCNYSKGFRYELSVLARNARTQSLCLWVGADVSLCAALGINAARAKKQVESTPTPELSGGVGLGSVEGVAGRGEEGDSGGGSGVATAYVDAAMRELWQRFEPPDARNRWDSPLVRVPMLSLTPNSLQRLAALAATRVHLPCSPALRDALSLPGSACSWWTPTPREQSLWQSQGYTEGGGGPFLTSRFALSAVHSAGTLAEERGGGSGVESLAASACRYSRQVADANAGYGAVPSRGFSAPRSAQQTVPPGTAPDYFSPDFNADVDWDAEEGGELETIKEEEAHSRGHGEGGAGGIPASATAVSVSHSRPHPGLARPVQHFSQTDDIADLNDFEGLLPTHREGDNTKSDTVGERRKGGSSFRRAPIKNLLPSASQEEGGSIGAAADAEKSGDSFPPPGISPPAPPSLAPALNALSPCNSEKVVVYGEKDLSQCGEWGGALKDGDALTESEMWVYRFFTGLIKGNAAHSIQGSDLSLAASLLHAEAGSSEVVGVVEEGLRAGAATPGAFLTVENCRPLLRFHRTPTFTEIHRIRREFLANCEANVKDAHLFADVGAAKKAFVLHLNALLRKPPL